MERQYFVIALDEIAGPYNVEQLRERVRLGTLTPEHELSIDRINWFHARLIWAQLTTVVDQAASENSGSADAGNSCTQWASVTQIVGYVAAAICLFAAASLMLLHQSQMSRYSSIDRSDHEFGTRLLSHGTPQLVIAAMLFILLTQLVIAAWVYKITVAFRESFDGDPPLTFGKAIVFLYLPVVNIVTAPMVFLEFWDFSSGARKGSQRKQSVHYLFWIWCLAHIGILFSWYWIPSARSPADIKETVALLCFCYAIALPIEALYIRGIQKFVEAE